MPRRGACPRLLADESDGYLQYRMPASWWVEPSPLGLLRKALDGVGVHAMILCAHLFHDAASPYRNDERCLTSAFSRTEVLLVAAPEARAHRCYSLVGTGDEPFGEVDHR